MNIFFCLPDTIEYDGCFYYSNPISIMIKRYCKVSDYMFCIAPIKDVDNPKSKRIDDTNVTFVNIGKLNSISEILHINKYINILSKYVNKSDYCVIHVHSSFVSNLAFEIASHLGKPIITVVCGCPWDALWNFNFKGKIIAPIAYLWLRFIQIRSKFSIYVTRSFLQKRYPTKGKWIACSNVELDFPSKIKKYEDLNSTHIRLGTIAAVNVRYKGQDYVIKALSLLKEKGFFYEYNIVGGGDQSYLKKIAKKFGVEDLVHFIGPLPHDQIPEFLYKTDIYIQPSLQEGLPRSVIEALNCGCLCLGSSIAGIPELIDEKYRFKPKDYVYISQLLETISKKSIIEESPNSIRTAMRYSKTDLDKQRWEFINNFRSIIQKRFLKSEK